MSEQKWERLGTILLPSGQAYEVQTNEPGRGDITEAEELAMWAESLHKGKPVWWGAGFRLVPVSWMTEPVPTMTCSATSAVDLSSGFPVPPTLTAADIYAAIDAARAEAMNTPGITAEAVLKMAGHLRDAPPPGTVTVEQFAAPGPLSELWCDPPAFKCATCRDKGRVVTGADGHGDGRITTHTAPCPDCGPML